MRFSLNQSLAVAVTGLLLGPAFLAGASGAAAEKKAPAPPEKAPDKAPADKTPSPEAIEFFEKRIRPLLAAECYPCHSAEEKNIQGELALDTRAGVLKGGSSGPAVVPGKPDASLLIKSVRHTGGPKMPPGKKLSDQQLADLAQWVRMGVPDPRTGPVAALPAFDAEKARQFWSFQPLRQPAVPAVKNTAWPRSAIDRFVLAKLEAKGLKAVGDADRRTLLRRVTFDLTGLPPTPEEVRAFLADRSPKALEKVVDRLLASPAYGERWGRHWLDLVRYADTAGCNSDFPIPNAFRYRNYVIDSINRDKPYDRFVQEQIAGDLLPSGSEKERYEKIVATSYLALARRFGSQANEFHLTLEDVIDNLGKTTMGLSMACARCHDHKYDPLLQKDYYALYGIFDSSTFSFPGTEVVPGEKDLVVLASGPEAEAAKKYDAELSSFGRSIFDKRQLSNRLRGSAEAAEKEAKEAPEDAEKAEAAQKARKAHEDLRDEIEQLQRRQKELVENPVEVPRAFAVFEGKPQNARIHRKGDPSAKGDVVERGFIQLLGGQTVPKDHKGSGRLELAQWLTSPDNPLFSRVMVNRIWQHHFGRGIVATPSDFGARGEKPTHPELLDYLAQRFIKSGWSLKAMHREMVLSRTYGLASTDDPKNLQADVSNSLLWRYNRHRLDAESIRDAMLAVSGALDRTMGQEHPFPPRSEWRYTQHRPFYGSYETDRRSVYLMQQRIRKQPFLETFDGADPNSNTAVRQVSTTALQALFVMNDAFIHEQARKLAQRVSAVSADPSARVNAAYWLAYNRAATPEELKLCDRFLRECRSEMAKAGVKPEERELSALASLMRVVLSSNEFVFVD